MGLIGPAFTVRSNFVGRRWVGRPEPPPKTGKIQCITFLACFRPRRAQKRSSLFFAHAPCRGKSTPKLPQNRAQCVRIHAVIEIGCRAFHLKRPPTAGTSKFLCFWPVLEPKGSHPGDPTLTVIAWVCLHFGWVLLLSCCLLLVPPEVCVN